MPLSAFPLVSPVGLRSWWMGFQLAGGGPRVAVNSCCQAVAQGHFAGSRSRVCRADLVTRAATAMSWVRIVAVTAFAWNADASAPTTRVRLNAIAAQTSQAELAMKFPDVIWSPFGWVPDVHDGG